MYGILLIGVGLIILGVVGALVWLVYLLFQPSQKKNVEASGAPQINHNPAPKGRRGWTLYIVIALLLLFWSFWISLLFLAVVWIMRLNPGKDSTYEVQKTEKNTASRVYTWLFFSSFITVPVFISTLFDTGEYVLVALIPLILHAPLLLGLTSKSAFVFRHTQQGILLIAVRAGIASLAVTLLDNDDEILGIGLFLLGNGSLWLFGSLWGWNQISGSECWLMKRKNETLKLAHPAYIHLEKSRAFIGQYKKNEARDHALAAFRNRDREIRLQAIQLLKTLDEVETF